MEIATFVSQSQADPALALLAAFAVEVEVSHAAQNVALLIRGDDAERANAALEAWLDDIEN